MTPSSAVTIFGSLTIDDLVFSDGSTRWGVPGGCAVYAAMGAMLWTSQVKIVAPLGPDYPAESLDKRIDLSHCPPATHTLRNWGLYEEDGRRHFVSRSASRDWAKFCPSPVDAIAAHQALAHVAPMPRALAVELIEELRRVGAESISLDLDDHDLLASSELDATVALIRKVDLFIPSRQDLHAIFPEAGPLEGLRRLRTFAPDVTLIAVKCGAEGVIAHVAGAPEWVRIPAIPVALADATGAGDAFCGGTLAGLAEAQDPVEGLLCGVVSASFCVEGLGFSGMAAATEEKAKDRLTMLRQLVEAHPF
ncbi:sugar/nucleoside kinase (ribokinase family) [Silvibacterium bohemicum]|uniref:Sugar/nucleoside kinase (Ribokinase family) n=1 Tax=Silvibacterium bohemicum TaxID=1577686 RepID=A0A841JUM8_9BACT|nr:PfkB family carbohydrate kinase [Silvibacterium bohemicum]MBB6142691.1 sugar/nucleoside kinase (ribokinase family) [Silvibacterium bohemicum]